MTELEPKLKKDSPDEIVEESKFKIQNDLEEELEPVLKPSDVAHEIKKHSNFGNEEKPLEEELEPVLVKEQAIDQKQSTFALQ